MIRNPVLTVWLRLISVLLVFFMVMVAIGSTPIRSPSVDMGQVLKTSLVSVFQGPALPLYWLGDIPGTLGAVVFWAAIIVTAIWSKNDRVHRWFYILLWIFIAMFALGILEGYAMGLIAMAHAVG